ncbi:hypothetical protein ABVK25_002449 [Lepraria finkii]|uniref:Sulfotransferase n=1 Tax=Lepraria finkii TaxID=1340010 RepID=A0ABR4BK59_9LECA
MSHCPFWTCAFEAKYHSSGSFLHPTGLGPTSGHLITAYPEAKVVLVERDVESWYRSFEGIINSYYMRINDIMEMLDPQLIGPTARLFAYVFRDRKGFSRTRRKQELQQNAKLVYREHYAHVRAITPKEKLLNFQLKEGWGPLREFLGKDVPGVPFPRLHGGDTLRDFQVRGC